MTGGARRGPTLACDVDSTVWDVAGTFHAAAREVTGEAPKPERVSTWTEVLELYGEEATARIYDRVFAPGLVGEREPYPNAAEVLRRLQAERGVRVHFVTRNHDPAALRPHLSPWLERHFGPEVGLTVTSGEKLPVVRELGAFGLVDDRPEALLAAAEAGLWAATRLQPWNRRLVAERPDLHGFEDWCEFWQLLPDPLG